MGNLLKILTAISGIIAGILKGVDYAKDFAEKRKRENEIETNTKEDKILHDNIKEGDTDKLNKEFDWSPDDDTAPIVRTPIKPKLTDEEINKLNNDFDWPAGAL